MRGRSSKLTPARREKIALAISACASYSAAARFAGVAESTFHSWLARGRAERDARRRDPRERRFVLLLEAVEQASARAEVRSASQLANAAGEDWRAAAWFLERRDPDNWGPPRLRIEHTEDPARTFDQLLEECSDEELEILQNVAARARRPT